MYMEMTKYEALIARGERYSSMFEQKDELGRKRGNVSSGTYAQEREGLFHDGLRCQYLTVVFG